MRHFDKFIMLVTLFFCLQMSNLIATTTTTTTAVCHQDLPNARSVSATLGWDANVFQADHQWLMAK